VERFKPMPPHSSLSILALLEDFVDQHREENIAVKDLVKHLGEHGLLSLLLVFALFCALPIPLPGIHIFLSLPLFYITIQQTMGRRILWLPGQVLHRTLPRAGFVMMIEQAKPWFIWAEKYVHPRMGHIIDGPGYRVMGAICLFITCIIIIPLPLTNVVPAISICIIALGMLCHDGFISLIGAILGLLWCFAWIVLASVIGWAGMMAIFTLLFN
jgi:hypothetical protein